MQGLGLRRKCQCYVSSLLDRSSWRAARTLGSHRIHSLGFNDLDYSWRFKCIQYALRCLRSLRVRTDCGSENGRSLNFRLHPTTGLIPPHGSTRTSTVARTEAAQEKWASRTLMGSISAPKRGHSAHRVLRVEWSTGGSRCSGAPGAKPAPGSTATECDLPLFLTSVGRAIRRGSSSFLSQTPWRVTGGGMRFMLCARLEI